MSNQTTSTQLLPLAAFTQWLARGERGVSSETIVGHLTGTQFVRRPSHPHDPADFRRCERLLRDVPIARFAFPAMRSASPVWARLVDEWDALVELGEREVPGAFNVRPPMGSAAPLLYARMRELISEGEAAS